MTGAMIKIATTFKRLCGDRRGAAAVTVGLFMTILIGMMGFVIDIGHVMYVKRQLQASTDSAALAGARVINCCATSTAVSTATAYSAAWTNSSTKGSNLNASPNLYVSLVSGYPKLKCFTSTGISCTGPDAANGIVVQQTASVPMWFASIFGLQSIPVTATATASGDGGGAGSYDIEIVLDTTASMGTTQDTSCGMTRINCALAGLSLILNKLSPQADYIGVMAFPPLLNAAQQTNDTTCPTSDPTTTAYADVAAGQPATYQVVPMSHNYQTTTQGTLNKSSGLVIAAGSSGVTGCSGIQAPGGFGTFYADAITAAQTDLTTNGRAGVQKAIIILSDGDANAVLNTTTTTGTGKNKKTVTTPVMTSAEVNNQCTEAVTAAKAATKAGMEVFTVAYGAETSGCSTDTGANATTPCATMQAMASQSTMFYSDDANGCKSPTQTLTSLIQMMGGLTSFFTSPRLLPDNTT
jgi:Flp pilus assembly protein TadG